VLAGIGGGERIGEGRRVGKDGAGIARAEHDGSAISGGDVAGRIEGLDSDRESRSGGRRCGTGRDDLGGRVAPTVTAAEVPLIVVLTVSFALTVKLTGGLEGHAAGECARAPVGGRERRRFTGSAAVVLVELNLIVPR